MCNLDECGTSDLDGKCFKNGHCVKLNRLPNSDCEDPNLDTQQECGPIDDAYPGRFYVPCRKTDHVGVHIVGGEKGTMRYQLPRGLKCDHCVVQWYWASANSCAPRGFLEYFKNYKDPFGETCPSDGGALGARNPTMSECGGDRVPEEFWSCSDVQITSDGSSSGSAVVSEGNTGDTGASSEGNTSDMQSTPEATPSEMPGKPESIPAEVQGTPEENPFETQAAAEGIAVEAQTTAKDNLGEMEAVPEASPSDVRDASESHSDSHNSYASMYNSDGSSFNQGFVTNMENIPSMSEGNMGYVTEYHKM